MMTDVAPDDFAREMWIDLLRVYDSVLVHSVSSNLRFREHP
jgi:hypothetical protein